MSASARDPSVRLAEDTMAGRRIAALVVLTLAAIVACVVWPWLSLRASEAALRRDRPPRLPRAEPTAPPPADIFASDIARDRLGARMRERDLAALERAEWVDRERGIARIPIERAMKVIVEKARSQDAPR
jgi:hypothetical protein